MAGLVPAIHVFAVIESKSWMPGTRPGMTTFKFDFGKSYAALLAGGTASTA